MDVSILFHIGPIREDSESDMADMAWRCVLLRFTGKVYERYSQLRRAVACFAGA
jgi:hypothetical protein